jgi:hypothetical protein
MPNKKSAIDPALAAVFNGAVEAEQSRRDDWRREDAQRRKQVAAEAARARKAETEKETAAKAFEKEITKKLFPSLEKLVNRVFDKTRRLSARITTDAATGETNLELILQRPHEQSSGAFYKDQNYWMTATVQGAELSMKSWGHSVDPQYRGWKRVVKPEELSLRVANIIATYASDAELAKLRRLTAPKETPAPVAAKPATDGIVIHPPLKLVLKPQSGNS